MKEKYLMTGSSEVRSQCKTAQPPTLSKTPLGLASQPPVSNNTCSRLSNSDFLSYSISFTLLLSLNQCLFFPVTLRSELSIEIIDQNNQREQYAEQEKRRKGERIKACYRSLLISHRDAQTPSSTKCLSELNWS